MGIMLVLDQGVPRDAAGRLRDLGYECAHVGEVGMSTAADEEILALARGTNDVVVTLDADFHTILAVFGAVGPSVIRTAGGRGSPAKGERNDARGSEGVSASDHSG